MRILTIITFAAVVGLSNATIVHAQGGPPVKERYIIVLNPPKNGVPDLTDHDITGAGGQIEYKVPGRIQVTLPAPAVEALRKHGRVKYIQKVILGPLPDASAPPALRFAPSATSLHATADVTPPTWRSGTYKYDTSGNIYAIGLAGDTGSPVQHRYGYDEVSRLKYADTITTTTHSETFYYDPYGNLIDHLDGGGETLTPVETTNTNRLKWTASGAYVYDSVGNLTADFHTAYKYDPHNMLREKDYTGMQPEYYVYTASDERIGVSYNNVTVWSIRDFGGNVLRQYEGYDATPTMSWLWKEDYVYRDGQLLAAERVREEGGRRHFHLDHLGSPRLVTGQDGLEMSEHDFAPFGSESNPLWQETNGGFDREDPKRYTGHERDYAGGGASPASTFVLDYMHARYYGPGVGRFLSVDKAAGIAARPQSWNKYSYCWNDPLKLTDPTGNVVQLAGGMLRRMAEFEAIAASLEDPTAAGQLIMATFGNGRSILSIAGDQSSFAASSPTAATLADAINSTATITFFLGSNSFDSGSRYPAFTAPVDDRLNYNEGSRNSLISIDPGGFPYYTTGGFFENVNSAIQHEFGHALGIANEAGRGRPPAGLWWGGTNPEAIASENKAREWYAWQAHKRYGYHSTAGNAADDVWRDRPNHAY